MSNRAVLATPKENGLVQEIPLELIQPSPDNPRGSLAKRTARRTRREH